jgi:uncharacterized protein YutE (UPF0331/DUF86 family)
MARTAASRPVATIERFAEVVREFELVAAHSLEEYRSSIYIRRSAERLVQLSCDMAVEMNCRALAGTKAGAPEGYEESFRLMADAGLLPGPLAEKMSAIAGLRRSLLYDDSPALDGEVHKRLPYFAVLLLEYGKQMEEVMAAVPAGMKR